VAVVPNIGKRGRLSRARRRGEVGERAGRLRGLQAIGVDHHPPAAITNEARRWSREKTPWAASCRCAILHCPEYVRCGLGARPTGGWQADVLTASLSNTGRRALAAVGCSRSVSFGIDLVLGGVDDEAWPVAAHAGHSRHRGSATHRQGHGLVVRTDAPAVVNSVSCLRRFAVVVPPLEEQEQERAAAKPPPEFEIRFFHRGSGHLRVFAEREFVARLDVAFEWVHEIDGEPGNIRSRGEL